jgi:hypothetical protein
MIDSILASPARTSPRLKHAGKKLPSPKAAPVEEDLDEFGLDDMLEESDEEVVTPTVYNNDATRGSSKPLSLSVLGAEGDDSGSGSGSSDSE